MNDKKDAFDLIKKIEYLKLPFRIRLFYFCFGYSLSYCFFYPKFEKIARIKIVNFRENLEFLKNMIKLEEKKN